MPAPQAENRRAGVWLHFRPRKWCLTPFFLPPFFALLLAGCASSPPPQPPTPPIDVPVTAPSIPPVEEWTSSSNATSRDFGENLADFALTMRGVPYRYGGATVAGFDCSGLVFFTHRRFGVDVPRTSRAQAEEAERVKRRKLERGDLVFFKIGSRHVNHVGIYIGDDQFVHAPGKGKPVTINSLNDEYYDRRFESAGRYWSRKPR